MTLQRLIRPCAALALLTLTACATTADPAPEAVKGGDYALDPAHTSVVWRVSHLGFSFYAGRFDQVEGTLALDRAAPEKAAVAITIDAASVSTGDADFDAEIAAKVFDAGDHPQIRFTSTAVRRTGERTAAIDGLLTMRGETRPVTLETTFIGAGETLFSGGREVVGFTAVTRFDRTEWGAGAWSAFGVGEEVDLRIDVEFQAVEDEE